MLVSCLTQLVIPWINDEAHKIKVYHAIEIIVVINILGMMHNAFRGDHESNTCNCVGDTLTYECTVMSGLGTIWRGSAFNCTSSGNEINFLESSITGDHDRMCNNGLISGRVIKIEGNNYTSQLNIILRSDLIGHIIECASYNGSYTTIISNTILDIRKWACT